MRTNGGKKINWGTALSQFYSPQNNQSESATPQNLEETIDSSVNVIGSEAEVKHLHRRHHHHQVKGSEAEVKHLHRRHHHHQVKGSEAGVQPQYLEETDNKSKSATPQYLEETDYSAQPQPAQGRVQLLICSLPVATEEVEVCICCTFFGIQTDTSITGIQIQWRGKRKVIL
jgi:hypothetical protein